MTFSNYRRLVRIIKAEYPHIKWCIRRCRVRKSVEGWCFEKDGTFYIQVSNELDEDLAISTLIHEASHPLSWKEWTKTEQHGPEFGKAYGEIYRLYEKHLTK